MAMATFHVVFHEPSGQHRPVHLVVEESPAKQKKQLSQLKTRLGSHTVLLLMHFISQRKSRGCPDLRTEVKYSTHWENGL